MTTSILARAHAQLQTLARPNLPQGNVRAQVETDDRAATVYLYDEIGGWGIRAAELVPELAALDVDTIELRLNSPGGDYFDGVAISNALEQHRARVVVHVDGMAASAASVVAMAGDEVVMHPGSRMMIHDALTLTVGNAADHEATRNLLDSVSEDIAELYAARSRRRSAQDWRADMRGERWLNPGEAVAAGLADQVASREADTPAVEPVAARSWPELIAQWRSLAPPQTSAPAATAEPDEPSADSSPAAVAPHVIAELMCSAFRKDVA